MLSSRSVLPRRLNLIWYYIFLPYGLSLSSGHHHPKYPRVKKFMYFFLLIFQVISNFLLFYLSMTHKILTEIEIFNVLALSIITISGFASNMVLHNQQKNVSLLLQKLVTSLQKSKSSLFNIWRRLITYLVLFTLHMLIYLIIHTLEFYQHNELSFLTNNRNKTAILDENLTKDHVKILVYIGSMQWYILCYVFIGIATILCIYSCQLSARNFELLTRTIEHSINSNIALNNQYLKKIILKYEAHCIDTEQISRLFSPLILIWTAVGVAVVAYSINTFLITSQLSIQAAMFVLRECFLLFLLYTHANDINLKASATALLISTLPVEDNTEETVAGNISNIKASAWQLLFTTRLQNRRIGINVSNLYIIKSM
uniref:Gustatory receptor n=1 Tax=Strigamia maritima TaxID=126957 RepID=T1JN83_STRMM